MALLPTYWALSYIRRAVLCVYMALWPIYRALLCVRMALWPICNIRRAFLCVHRALWPIYRVLLWVRRALLCVSRALLREMRHDNIITLLWPYARVHTHHSCVYALFICKRTIHSHRSHKHHSFEYTPHSFAYITYAPFIYNHTHQ